MIKVCFVGIGSIAKRHIQNLKTILNTNVEIHALRSSKNELCAPYNQYIKKIFYSIDDLDNKYDIIFITNPTIYHYRKIVELSEKTTYFFVEKPIFDNLEYDIDYIKNKNIYVACPMRYTKVFQYIKNYISDKQVISARAISSSYLPDWRKGVDYRQIYSARKELGGGVNIDLIHEWDYIVDLFGFPEKSYSVDGKFSNLEITSNDIFVAIAKYRDKIVEMHLDYFGRKAQRILELYLNDEKIVVDFLENTIYFQCTNEKIHYEIDSNYEYIQELNTFLEIYAGKRQNINTLEHAREVLKLALS